MTQSSHTDGTPGVRRDAIMEAVAFAAQRFLEIPDWHDAADEILKRLGQAAGVSRTYVFENHVDELGRECCSQRFEWVAPGIQPLIDDDELQAQPWHEAGFARWTRLLGGGDPVVGLVRNFPDSERPQLDRQEIVSILIVPVFAGAEWWGTIGFDDCAGEREWNPAELDALRTAAGILGAVVERRRAERRTQEAESRQRELVEGLPVVTYQEIVPAPGYPSATLVYMSPKIRDLLGYPAELWEDDPTFWTRVIHPDDLGTVMAESSRASGAIETYRQEYRMLSRDGRTVWVHDEASLLSRPGAWPQTWQGVLLDITDRKQAERLLESAEVRFRALAENVPVLIYAEGLDAAVDELYIGPQVLAMLGYEPQEWVTTPLFWRDRIHPDDRARVMDADAHANDRLETFAEEYRFRAKGGRWVWLRDEAVVVRDGQGRPQYWQGCMIDVTERKRAEDALIYAEARSRTLVEHIPAMTYVESLDAAAELFYISPQVEQILGYTPEEWALTEDFWTTRIHPDDAERVLAEDARTDATHDPVQMEYRFLAKDGSYRWLHDEAVFVEEEGQPPFWQGFLLDITERKAAEDALRDSEERYRDLFENANDLIYTHDLRGTVTSMNKAAVGLLGFRQEEIVGQDLSRFLAPEHVPRIRKMIARGLAGISAASFELEFFDRVGKRIPIEVSMRLVTNEGKPVGVQTIARDITERKRAEEELERALAVEREATQRLRAVDEMKNTFLQAVSHDLRTPLAAILGLAVTLGSPDVRLEPGEATELADRIAVNARKLDRLVTDLLDLDRLSRGIIEPNLQPVDMMELLRRVVDEADLLGDRTVVVGSESLVVRVDPAKVERIVENLLANTARHTPAHSSIWVSARPAAGGVVIAIEDDGGGVPADERAQIFEPFRQGSDAPTHSPGVGVGLTLVARFAELHGGRAWVEERAGGGASFRVFLPDGDDQPVEDTAEESERDVAGSLPPQPGAVSAG
jgi:PAS domain S-box-containing protein